MKLRHLMLTYRAGTSEIHPNYQMHAADPNDGGSGQQSLSLARLVQFFAAQSDSKTGPALGLVNGSSLRRERQRAAICLPETNSANRRQLQPDNKEKKYGT